LGELHNLGRCQVKTVGCRRPIGDDVRKATAAWGEELAMSGKMREILDRSQGHSRTDPQARRPPGAGSFRKSARMPSSYIPQSGRWIGHRGITQKNLHVFSARTHLRPLWQGGYPSNHAGGPSPGDPTTDVPPDFHLRASIVVDSGIGVGASARGTMLVTDLNPNRSAPRASSPHTLQVSGRALGGQPPGQKPFARASATI